MCNILRVKTSPRCMSEPYHNSEFKCPSLSPLSLPPFAIAILIAVSEHLNARSFRGKVRALAERINSTIRCFCGCFDDLERCALILFCFLLFRSCVSGSSCEMLLFKLTAGQVHGNSQGSVKTYEEHYCINCCINDEVHVQMCNGGRSVKI